MDEMEHLSPRSRSRRGFYLILVVVLVIAFGIGIYLYFVGSALKSEKLSESAAQDKVTAAVGQGIIPNIAPTVNPLKDVSNVNPIKQANPFNNLKTNPF